MTAKELLLERLPTLTEAQAVAMLRVADAQVELAEYFDRETAMSPGEFDVRGDAQAYANAIRAIREEPW